MSTSDFRQWYGEAFGAAFPFDPGPLAMRSAGVWSSPDFAIAAGELPMTPEMRAAPGDYGLFGTWGHGVQSHALYCVERCGAHRAFLRLPWGGAYGDGARDAENVRRALASYAHFRARRGEVLAGSDVVANMGDERAQLVWPDGATRSIVGPSPLLAAPPFWEALAAVL